ncbi:16745_t:CDS:2, partial [Acaulospora colombiana]
MHQKIFNIPTTPISVPRTTKGVKTLQIPQQLIISPNIPMEPVTVAIAEEKFEQALKDNDIHAQITLQEALKFNGGGHINHSLFWTNLAPIKEGGGEPPKGALHNAIQKDFGSLEDFISKFNTVLAGGYNKANKRLEIVTLPNQDPLI